MLRKRRSPHRIESPRRRASGHCFASGHSGQDRRVQHAARRPATLLATLAAGLMLVASAASPAQAQWGASFYAGWGCGPYYGQFTAATVQIGGFGGCAFAGPVVPFVPACALPPLCGPVMLPPIFIPPGLLYGPGPVFDMLYGVAWRTGGFAGPLIPPGLNALNQRPLDGLVGDPLPPVPVVNEAARARAWRFIEMGNRYFDEQNFRRAYVRYDKAAQAAPDLVEAHLLKGQALIAIGSYDMAARAFKQALRNDKWTDCQLRWDNVYGKNRVAKTAHIENLAEAAQNDPHNPDLMLLLGMELFFDGQIERSVKFFQEYAALRDAGQVAGEIAQLPQQPADIRPVADNRPVPQPPPKVDVPEVQNAKAF
jgi:hypothetical protein